MALVERLMKTDPDETRHMAVHTFFAAMHEVAEGAISVNQVKSALNTTAADDVELDALIAAAPVGDGALAMYINRLHSVFILAETREQGYATESQIRSRLGL